MRTICIALAALCGSVLPAAAEVAPSPQEATPLPVGATVPDVSVFTIQDEPVALRGALADKPTVLVFYRGGWCPYCNRQLAGLQEIVPRLRDLGFQIVAVSPDPVAELSKTREKHGLDFTLLSDHEFAAVQAFGLAFKLDDEALKKYAVYHVPLYSPPGSDDKVLPVPAVYLVDAAGTIEFVYANPDYKIRLDPEELLKAAERNRP